MTTRDQRALVFGVIAVLLLVVAPRAFAQWREHSIALHESQKRIDSELTRFMQLSSSHREVSRALHTRELMLLSMDSLLISGVSNADVSATFAELLSEAARISEVSVGSIRVEIDSMFKTGASSRPDSRLLNIATRVSIAGTASAVMAFVQWVETSPPLMAIDEIAITASQPTTSADQARLQAVLRVRGVAIRGPDESVRARLSSKKDQGL